MNNLKKLLITGGVIAIIIIAAVIYTVVTKSPETSLTNSNNNQSNEQANENANKANSDLLTYNSKDGRFSFQYSPELEAGADDFVYLPYDNNRQVETEAHFFDPLAVEYCAPSGECKDTTINISFHVTILNAKIADIQNKLSDQAQFKNFGSIPALTYSQGAEGEGINYYFISLQENKTLMLDQKYIDENVLLNYKKEERFIPYTEQNKIMEQIISTINFK